MSEGDDDGDDEPFFPRWLKILAVSATCIVFVVPLFLVIFYSYFTHSDANTLLGYVIQYTWTGPVIWGFTILAWVFIIVGLVAKYGYRKKL